LIVGGTIEFMDPVRFVLICLAGWINLSQQDDAIEYLREEVRVLREQLDAFCSSNTTS
jgi:hypothetical protein